MTNKPNILMMPSWYPTAENPISGSFFKEQATELAKDFNFVVLHYSVDEMSFLRYVKGFLSRKNIVMKIDKSNDVLPEFTFKFFLPAKSGIVFKVLSKLKILQFLSAYILKVRLKEMRQALVKEFNFMPNLVYAMTAQVNATDAAVVSKFLDVPYVLAEHCPFPLAGTAITNDKKKAIENADGIISISRDKTRQMLMQGLNITPKLVGNMVDEDVFTLPVNKNNVDKNKIFTILIVASYNLYKDYPTFFKSMKKLCNISKNKFHLLIVGFAPVSNPEWALGEKEFEELVCSYGLLDISTLVPKVPREEMVNYYHAADVFVMTSIQEGFPVSSLEATSCGLPVYSTRCGGVDDFIDDENGRLFNIQDWETMAKELRKLVDGELSFDSNRIRKKTIELYGKSAFRNRMTHIFNEVIEEHAASNKKNNSFSC